MEWRLADAKNRFSELVNRALVEGPQRVRRHKDAVIVVAERDYEKLTRKRPNFKEFLTGPGPSLEGLDLARDRSAMRKVNWPDGYAESFAEVPDGFTRPLQARPRRRRH